MLVSYLLAKILDIHDMKLLLFAFCLVWNLIGRVNKNAIDHFVLIIITAQNFQNSLHCLSSEGP